MSEEPTGTPSTLSIEARRKLILDALKEAGPRGLSLIELGEIDDIELNDIDPLTRDGFVKSGGNVFLHADFAESERDS